MLRTDNGSIVLGVTGGVASGKSTAVRFLVERGAAGVSADEIARELLSPGSLMTERVIEHFGSSIALNGGVPEIDRAKLARRIFADDRARRELGELMHPTIHRLIQEHIEQARFYPNCRMVAVEIPLLFENGLQSSVDKVLTALCPEDEQMRRLMARHPAIGQIDALRQIRAQMPIEDKARMSDFTINTAQPIDVVRQEANTLYDRLTEFLPNIPSRQ
jgi:dephospho-CoA kinase